MKRPLIGITCGTSAADTSATLVPQDRLNRSYSRAVEMAGGVPVIVPNLEAAYDYGALLASLDGLMLSGGLDVAPALYGQSTLNDTVETDPPRDAAEIPLIHAALDRELPILAICRGIQSLNVALGGTLIQDIPQQHPSHIQHRQQEARSLATHAISVQPGTAFSEIVGERMDVNSMHHQALDHVADPLRVTARAEDGIVEAAEMPGYPFLVAVQFHPEEMAATSPQALRLFQALAAASARL